MRTTQALKVRTATRPGSASRPNEDKVFTTDSAVVLLDGATGSTEPRSGGWYAEQLGGVLSGALTRGGGLDLRVILADSIRQVVDRFDLQPGKSPSSTVVMLRVRDDMLDVLVLGDSVLVLQAHDGGHSVTVDHRIATVATAERSALRRASTEYATEARKVLVEAEAEARNRLNGYWIAEATPEAAYHALTRSVPLADIRAALLMSDGVSAGVERYRTPPTWEEAFRIARGTLDDLIEVVAKTESGDPERRRWRRSKTHDDKAVAYVDLGEAET